jgi:hypothetical protein
VEPAAPLSRHNPHDARELRLESWRSTLVEICASRQPCVRQATLEHLATPMPISTGYFRACASDSRAADDDVHQLRLMISPVCSQSYVRPPPAISSSSSPASRTAASHAASLQRGYRRTASARDQEVAPLTGVAGRLDRALRNFSETFPCSRLWSSPRMRSAATTRSLNPVRFSISWRGSPIFHSTPLACPSSARWPGMSRPSA